MGSIADKLAYLAETKAMLKRNLIAKGYEVADSMTFRQLVELLGEYSEDLDNLIPGRLLLWNEEFDGDALDTGVWNYELGYIRNNEAQYYTDETKNISVSDSMLHIIALKDNPADGYEWSSASIDSQSRSADELPGNTPFSYGYGLIECRMRCLTPSSGVWPAFWSRGASQPGEGWPMCGEIDIGELFFDSASGGHRFNPGIFWYDWHGLAQKSQPGTDTGLSTGSRVFKEVDTDWHIYGAERNENAMIFYYDRQEICRIDLTALDGSDIQKAMGQPMSVKLNLAMGSTGGTIPADLERAQIDVDYIRYYAPSGVTAATDSGEWDFPSYMPTEVVPGKVIRIIPERDMTTGRNQYLWWTSSDDGIAEASAGIIRTKTAGNVTVTMHDVFGHSKSANITVKESANCVSHEVREIPVNPSIVPNGETVNVNVRLVPNWVTNHTVTAALSPAVDGVTVSVSEGSQAIAKYTTPISVITITNNTTVAEDVETSLIVTAQDSGVSLSIPLTIKKLARKLDTTGMYAAYVADNIVETESTVGTIYDEAGDHVPLTNLFYSASNINGICRVPGKGIQSQVQGGSFNPSTATGFFLEEFDQTKSRTFVFSVKAGIGELRQLYYMYCGMLSVVHSGIGGNNVSNSTDGRHGMEWSYGYSASSAEGSISQMGATPYAGKSAFKSGDVLIDPTNTIVPDGDLTALVRGNESEFTVFCVYDASDTSLAAYLIFAGKFCYAGYNGMRHALNATSASSGNYGKTLDMTVNAGILAEAETDPFYWRYGNGKQVCSDFVRAICVYDHVLTKDEMLAADAMLTDYFE